MLYQNSCESNNKSALSRRSLSRTINRASNFFSLKPLLSVVKILSELKDGEQLQFLFIYLFFYLHFFYLFIYLFIYISFIYLFIYLLFIHLYLTNNLTNLQFVKKSETSYSHNEICEAN